jgi:rare lipoprotein A (peptidoglycan hydrolase)
MFSAICAVLLAAASASSLQSGLATWYATPGLTAAAGPLLRHGAWRAQLVTVTAANGNSVTVTLTDWCACGDRHGIPTLLDLSAGAFRRLAPLSRGVVAVEVEVLTRVPTVLPATDTVP